MSGIELPRINGSWFVFMNPSYGYYSSAAKDYHPENVEIYFSLSIKELLTKSSFAYISVVSKPLFNTSFMAIYVISHL